MIPRGSAARRNTMRNTPRDLFIREKFTKDRNAARKQ
jgi:hypothetical protein